MITILIRADGGAPEKCVIDVDETNVKAVANVVYNALRNHNIGATLREEYL